MKTSSLFLGFFLLSVSSYSQVETAQVGAEMQEVSKNAGRQIQGIETFSSGTVLGSQFFYPTWTSGSVTTVNNEVISKDYSFIYDKVRQQLFIKWKDSSAILIGDRDQIKAFTLNTDKVHTFVSARLYGPSKSDDFFEVLVNNDKGYSLLKMIKTKFVKADPTDIQKMKDGQDYDEFVDNITYYISYNHALPQQISLKEKSFEKAFPALKDKIIQYFNQNDNGTQNGEAFIKGFVQSLNS